MIKRKRGRPPRNKRDIYIPRDGFTKRDQVQALKLVKEAQYRTQSGICSYCDEPLPFDCSAWVNCRCGPPLSKWAFCDYREFDPVNLCQTYRPRSPAEIEEEYRTGGHELIHQGCVIKHRNARYSTAGHTKGQLAEYEALLKELGFGEHTPDAATAFTLWERAAKRLTARRLKHLATIRQRGFETMKKNNPNWGTGKRRPARPLGVVKESGDYRTPEPLAEPGVGPTPVSTAEDVLAAGREMDAQAQNDPATCDIVEMGMKALREAQERAAVAG